MSERRGKIKLQEGFTLIVLVIATAIIGVVVAVAVPQFTAYKNRAYDANVQSNLRAVFSACQEFWTFNSSKSPCLLTTIANNGDGFIPSDAVKVTIKSDADNTEYDFHATASHTSSSNTYMIDHRGVVSKTSDGDGQTGENGDGNSDANNGDDGNNGNDKDKDEKNGPGCSDEAHTDPHDLGGNAKGGCGTASGNNSGKSDGTNSASNEGNNSGKNKWWEGWWEQWKKK